MQATQENRTVQVTTPLATNVLLFSRMKGFERLSQPFCYDLELLSVSDGIEPKQMLGQPVTVQVALPDGTLRYFHGYAVRFGQLGIKDEFASYHVTVRPWLWFLTRTADSRIFQNLTVPDIIKQVFSKHGFTDFKESLSNSYRTREYCVQYRESDFCFVSRLMEEEGIYYYFTHTANKHLLVLSDSISAHAKTAGYETIPFHPEPAAGLDRTRQDHVYEWDTTGMVQPGDYVLTDYDFEKPSAGLLVKSQVRRSHPHASYQCYDYPGEYTVVGDGESLVRCRIEELQAQAEGFAGTGNARGLAVGSLFSLAEHPRTAMNREYLVTSAKYQLESNQYSSGPLSKRFASDLDFVCQFRAMDKTLPFRPPRNTPRPSVKGPQTAVVVGPSGEEIYTDKYGRVKVQFHWDRDGTRDENSSCWVRVSHPWAGKNWGMVSIPRIGQEVIVDFLEGDPDQPIITGRVYNAEQMPPYALPDNMTQTGIKSRSTKSGGTDNFNELRFEDKKGSEMVFLHAEKDQTIEVENDESHWVGHDRTKKVDNDEKVTIGKNRTESVGANENITIGKNRTEAVAENESIAIGMNRTEAVTQNETIAIGKNRTETVGENEEISIGKNRNETVAENETVNIGKNQTLDVGEKRQTTVGKDDMNQVGKKFYLEAGDEITLKTGDASIILKKDGTIQIKGKDITISGSGKIGIKASGDMVLKGSKIAEN